MNADPTRWAASAVLWGLALACAGPGSTQVAQAQTRLRLSTILPGTEKVQLINNGDFQFQGPALTNSHPFPIGWSRGGDMFVGPGTNTVAANNGAIAMASVSGGAGVSSYSRAVRLEADTAYVLSAYLWNLGNAANHVTTVIDLNDAPGEPQVTLSYADAGADLGYFAYRSFNTATTGSNVTLRLFYDSLTGTGAAPAYFPMAAQWGNIAITKAAEFLAPQASGSAGNLRPVVRINTPVDGQSLFVETVPAAMTVTTSALDLDGSVTKVELYAGTAKVAAATSNPFTLVWSNSASGAYRLTAVATDNAGATTVSAPVNLALFVAPQPVTLAIAALGPNLRVSWPTSATPAALQYAPSLAAAAGWHLVTNAVAVSNGQNVVTLPRSAASQFFRLGAEVDASTLDRKLLMGYQGWFACPQDGSAYNGWVHWFRSQTAVATNATVDFWPDISELGADELFSTGMTLPNGNPARVFSSYNQKTVLRHFRWMKDNHLDGVFLQRFSSSLSDATAFAFRNQVTANVRLGADTYGRAFAIMYDISGQASNTLVSKLTNDWSYLVNTMQVTNSPWYLRHHGKPVVAIWGFGFTDRPGTPQDAQTVVSFFKAAGCTVMGGVPTNWRTLSGDSQTNAAWAGAYRAFDVISPWAVGRYSSAAGADSFKTTYIVPDLADTKSHGLEYMPVIFPGFSWKNLNAGPLNQIPRLGGSFYWRQVYNAVSAGCTMLYGAMFDEMDEGTAMLKLAPTAAELPAQGSFVPLNIDGQALPADWYLRVADQAGKMLRGEIPRQSTLPISP